MLTLGTTLLYRLSIDDVRRITEQRGTSTTTGRGNAHSVGEPRPLLVTAITLEGDGATTHINGQVLLDGADQLWVTHVREGAGWGEWDRSYALADLAEEVAILRVGIQLDTDALRTRIAAVEQALAEAARRTTTTPVAQGSGGDSSVATDSIATNSVATDPQ